MKYLIIVMVFLVGCSNKGNLKDKGIDPGADAVTPISEQRAASSDFRKQGIKVFYTLFGDVEAIETTAEAPVWGNSANAIRDAYRVAELEAKKSLNDFINKETITSSVSVKMLSKNLEKADDQKKNAFSTNVDPELSESDDELNNQSSDNTAFRNDALNIANRLSTVITSHSRGILGGLYLVEGEPTADGDRVRVTYRWDKKHTEVRLQVRNLMGQ